MWQAENRLAKGTTDLYQGKVTQGWTPDVINGRNEMTISCSMQTLYRQFEEKIFDQATLPMKGKRKPNGLQEPRGKQTFKRNIAESETDYPLRSKKSLVMSKVTPLWVPITRAPSLLW